MEAKHKNTDVRIVLLELDRDSQTSKRFEMLFRNVQIDFSGIDSFLGIN